MLPGGTLLSRICVYAGEAPDGQRGGTPHMHLACSEMYYVLRGEGAVEFLNYEGFQCHAVRQDTALTFTPGTIHRLINPNGDLEVLVLMQNKGLPERDDVAVTFPEATMRSAEAHDAALRVAEEADAARRCELSVRGFLELKDAFKADPEQGRRRLERFYALAIERRRALFNQWRAVIRDGPQSLAQADLERLDQLEQGSTAPLHAGRVMPVTTGGREVLGFCGRINPYHPREPEVHTPEGVRAG
ncbi:MAG: cupin domain-containing protein [Phycisphaeraceae bacterium]